MLKEKADFIRTILYVIELVMLSLMFVLTYFLLTLHESFYKADFFPEVHFLQKPYSADLYLRVYWVVLVIWTILLRMRGEYHHLRVQTYPKVISNVLLTGLLFFGFFTSFAFLFKFDYLSRGFIVLYTLVCTLFLLVNRIFILSLAFYIRKRGHNSKNILLVGTGRRAQEFLSLAAKHREWGYRVIGLLDLDPAMKNTSVAGYPVLGTVDDLPKLLDNNVIDEVIFVVPRNWLQDIEKCILYCEAVGIPATLSTDFFDLEIANGVPTALEGFTYLTFETSRLKEPELFVKRTVDIVFSALGLMVMAPVLLFVALCIKVTSPGGPVFFKQIRSGRNGRKFTLYKFRSMVPGAEAKLAELKEKNEMSGPVFKMEHDPRVTKIGKFIRKTSLDEFPQLWNVLKGDMSLVGPRPPIPAEVEQYEPWQRRRLSMKPGITCIWQVSGRNNIDFENWMRLDLQYIDRWSLWLDMKILLLTVKAVLSSHGAK